MIQEKTFPHSIFCHPHPLLLFSKIQTYAGPYNKELGFANFSYNNVIFIVIYVSIHKVISDFKYICLSLASSLIFYHCGNFVFCPCHLGPHKYKNKVKEKVKQNNQLKSIFYLQKKNEKDLFKRLWKQNCAKFNSYLVGYRSYTGNLILQ